MNIPIFATVAYVVITSIIGMTAGRRGKGVREYFIAGGTLPWFMLVPFLMAEYISATVTVGNAEMAYESGVSSLWYFFGAPIGLAILAFGMAKFYTSIRMITIGEAFGVLFDQRTRLVCISVLLVATALSGASAFLALGAILAPMFNIPYEMAVWLSTAIMVAIAVVGGLRGIAWMNMVHIFVIIIGFAIGAMVSVNAVGGLGNIFASVPQEHLNLARPGGFTVTAWLVGSIGVKLVSTIGVTGMFAAKDERSARIGALTAGAFVFIFAFIPMLIGLSAYIVMPDIPSRLALWKMGEYCGPAISTVLSIGVIAAIISTTPGTLLAKGAIATRDIFLVIKPGASERVQLIFSKIIVVVIGFGGAWFALTQPSILKLVMKSMQVRVILATILLISVLWRRIHPTAAFWTAVFGGGGGFIWFITGSPFGIEPLWPGLGIGMLTLIITSLRKRPSPFKGAEGLEITLRTDGGQKA